ncbi:maker571 [Drosophila busckii]|uniref:Maker571 n=1 Tax=Drosophila busckii TaxID=30019 RepID=A0A0M4ESF5_DROBS|nr:protein gurken isoform X2 [Drosophila busckii]ALC39995.1 maker571 [Drosophila busckii]
MQIKCLFILKVIFVLSTIVTVTDCCSSRILLLRPHILQIEERVVQLELKQSFDANGPPLEADGYADTAELLRNFISAEPVLPAENVPLTTTDIAIIITATPATTIPTTLTPTLATGEPPPNDSTQRNSSDQSTSTNLDISDVIPTTTVVPSSTTMTTTTTTATTRATTTESKRSCSINYFCLNGGKCFRYDIGNSSLNYCECAEDFVGERCESKTENGVIVSLGPTAEPQLKTAHIVFSFPMLLLLSTIYVVFGAIFMFRNVSAHRRKEQQQKLNLHDQRFFISC